MKNVYEILRLKKAELQTLQEEVRALEIAARLLGEDQDLVTSALNEKSGALSQPQMIRAVLLAQGKPMESREISEAIAKRFRKTIKPEHITATVYRHIKKHSLFVKTEAPNTFGLLEVSATGRQPQGILRVVETKS